MDGETLMMFLAVPKPFQKTSKQFSLQHYMLCSRVISNLGSFISEKLHVCTYVSCSALRLRLFSTVFDFSPLYLFTLGLGGSRGVVHRGGRKLGVFTRGLRPSGAKSLGCHWEMPLVRYWGQPLFRAHRCAYFCLVGVHYIHIHPYPF